MSDLLVKLYDLPPPGAALPAETVVRKPIGPEHRLLIDWVGDRFGEAWASETQVALGNRPVSVFIALRGPALLGFACYDATARGFFGPIGVAQPIRGQRLGAGLLRACLDDMRGAGYGYAVIGGAGPSGFFQRTVGAVEIPGSSPGIYAGMLRAGSVVDPASRPD